MQGSKNLPFSGVNLIYSCYRVADCCILALGPPKIGHAPPKEVKSLN